VLASWFVLVMERWKASFSVKWSNGFGRSFQGCVVVRLGDSNLILLSDHGRIMDRQPLKEGETLKSGMIVSFPCHSAVLGELIHPDPSQVEIVAAPSLNFKRGIDFEDNIWLKFGHPVNHVSSARHRDFLLVASFSRSHFRLNVHTVGIVL
jgi:hypothetical protein